MSKITFRADEDLVERLEEFDASKSEVMRQALREFLDGQDRRRAETGAPEPDPATVTDSIDRLITERVDTLVEDRLDRWERRSQDIDLTVSLDGAVRDSGRKTNHRSSPPASDDLEPDRSSCGQCGESVEADHVYCPNCGEKASRRVFCECGDEIRSDWAFCPGCGRRTAAADVFDST